MKQYQFLVKIALTAAFSFGSLVTSAQAPAIQWDKTFGGTNSDRLHSLRQTADGGYILGGYSASNISGDKTTTAKGFGDFWLIKLDAAGNKQWDKTFGGSNPDVLFALEQTTDGGYILGGTSSSPISGDKSDPNIGNSDFWLIKTDTNGNKTWDRTYGGYGEEIIESLQQTADGGYILGGWSNSDSGFDKSQNSVGGYDFWILKVDSNGNKQWDKTFGGTLLEDFSTVKQTQDGGYVLGGFSLSGIGGDKSQNSKGGSDYWVVKLDANGNKQWDKSYGGNDRDFLYSLQITTDGGYILGGTSDSDISGDKTQTYQGLTDFWVVKIDSTGNIMWDKTFGGNNDDVINSLIQTPDGSYMLAGQSNSNLIGDKSENRRGGDDFWLIKIDSNGNKLWDKTIGGLGSDFITSIQLTTDGGYITGGWSLSNNSFEKSEVSRGGEDFWIVKLGPDATTGINDPTTSFTLSISPNPSQGKFQLQLNNLTAKTGAITVSDLVGRTVYQQEIPVIGKQLQEEINLPAVKGMYVLQVKAGAQTSTRKIVVE